MGWANLIGGSVLAVVLVAISVIDLRERRIPDKFTFPLIAAGLGLAALHSTAAFQTHLIGACAGFLPLALFGEIFFRLRGVEGLGLGDAKLFGAAGAWLGWQSLPYVLLVASLSGLIFALIAHRRIDREAGIAFGPFIAAGFFAMWLFAGQTIGVIGVQN